MYNYNYNSDFTDVFAGGLIIFLIIIYLIILAVAVFQIVCQWKVYKKAGKNGWEAIIPIYNAWVLFEISGYPGWIALIALACVIPVVGAFVGIAILVFEILAAMSLAEKFGKEKVFGLLLAFVPVVGYAILAFGDAEYDDSLGNQPGTKAVSSNNSNTSTDKVFCSNCGTAVDKGTKFCPNCGEKI